MTAGLLAYYERHVGSKDTTGLLAEGTMDTTHGTSSSNFGYVNIDNQNDTATITAAATSATTSTIHYQSHKHIIIIIIIIIIFIMKLSNTEIIGLHTLTYTVS